MRVDDVEDAPLSDYFDEINGFIHAARSGGGSVLVHCYQGKSRSACAVVQYLLTKLGMDLRGALRTTTKNRAIKLNRWVHAAGWWGVGGGVGVEPGGGGGVVLRVGGGSIGVGVGVGDGG